MTLFWESTALRQDSIQMSISPGLLPATSSTSTLMVFMQHTPLPFGTLLEKIPSSRPFFYSLETREKNPPVILWQFPDEWRYIRFGDLFQKCFIITLALSTSTTSSLLLLLSFFLYHSVILIINTAGNTNLLFCC